LSCGLPARLAGGGVVCGKWKVFSIFARWKIKKQKIMQTAALLNQIYQLPLYDRMLIVERTVHSMRTNTGELENSAALMADEYRNNKELTSFTQLDIENFYEAR
jgi:hypothetical protein